MAFAVMVASTKKTSAKRVQYAALPFRRNGKSPTEVLLVTSRELRLGLYLGDVLACEVDVTDRKAVKPRLRDYILRDAVPAF